MLKFGLMDVARGLDRLTEKAGEKLKDADLGAAINKGPIGLAEAAATQLKEVDWKKTGDQIQEAGTSAAKTMGDVTGTLTTEARAFWNEHGLGTKLTGALSNLNDRRIALREATDGKHISELPGMVAAWANQLIEEEGPEAAHDQMVQLKASLSAADPIATTHDKKARSVPRHKGRPDPADKEAVSSLDTIAAALDSAIALAAAKLKGVDVHAITSQASGFAWAAGGTVAKGATDIAKSLGSDGGQGILDQLSKARQSAGKMIEDVSPKWVTDTYQELKTVMAQASEHAEKALLGLEDVEKIKDDKDALFDRFTGVLESSRYVTDGQADAISVGFLKEAAGLASGGVGKELIYLRETGELRVIDLELAGARLGVGASQRPFARSHYGSADAIKETKFRHTGEVGALIFHAGSGWSDKNPKTKETVRSSHVTLGIGLHASIPLLADQSAYSIRETDMALHKLTPDQQDKIESLLQDVPKSSKQWTGTLRRTLGLKSKRPAA